MNKINELVAVLSQPGLIPNPDVLREWEIDELTIQNIQELNTAITSHLQSQSDMGQILQKEMQISAEDSFRVMKRLKTSLEEVLVESKSIQGLSKWMFGLTFALGFVLIGFSIYFAMKGQETMAMVFGSIGLIDIIAHLIADPPMKAQDSRSNYAQLTVGILAWFSDIMNNNAVLAQAQNLPYEQFAEEYRKLSSQQMENTNKILRLLDDVAEPTNKKMTKLKEALIPDLSD